VQATNGRSPPVVFRGDRAGDQLNTCSAAGSDAKADILREQGATRARSKVLNLRESSIGRGALGEEAPSLLPELHGGSNDGSSNQQGSGAGVILEGPNGLLIEQALRFAFKASNNQAEYEALIAGMLLAKEMGAWSLLAKTDSQLVTGQVIVEYKAIDPQMTAYMGYAQVLKGAFMVFELVHVPREQNARADMLAKLANSGMGGRQRTVIQETLKTPRTFVADNRVSVLQISMFKGRATSHRSLTQDKLRTPSVSVYPVSPGGKDPMQVCVLEEGDTRMTPYRRYLADGILPVEPEEGKKVKRNSARYTLVDGALFRHGFTHPIITCVSGD